MYNYFNKAMKHILKTILILSLALTTSFSFAQSDTVVTTDDDVLDLFDLSLEELLNVDVSANNKFALYGFINSNVERVYAEPSIDGTT